VEMRAFGLEAACVDAKNSLSGLLWVQFELSHGCTTQMKKMIVGRNFVACVCGTMACVCVLRALFVFVCVRVLI